MSSSDCDRSRLNAFWKRKQKEKEHKDIVLCRIVPKEEHEAEVRRRSALARRKFFPKVIGIVEDSDVVSAVPPTVLVAACPRRIRRLLRRGG